MSSKKESIQKKLEKFKPPRVSITYDTFSEDRKKTTHSLPFVMGVMGNYSGHKERKVKKLKGQNFLEVGKQNFDGLVQSIAPELHLKVENKINDKTELLDIDMKFTGMADFNPGKIAHNVEPLKKLMETRKKLLMAKDLIQSNDKLEQVLTSLAKNHQALDKFLPAGDESSSDNESKD